VVQDQERVKGGTRPQPPSPIRDRPPLGFPELYLYLIYMTTSTTLPDISTYSSQPPQLTDTVMIHASTAEKYSYPEHATPYLLVSNFVNRGNYLLNRRQVEISASHFYFLNPNDTLEIRFSTAAPLQTCMLLFEDKFMGACFHYLYTSAERLLDPPQGHPGRIRTSFRLYYLN